MTRRVHFDSKAKIDHPLKVGQAWLDLDDRSKKRVIRVTRISDDYNPPIFEAEIVLPVNLAGRKHVYRIDAFVRRIGLMHGYGLLTPEAAGKLGVAP